MNAGYAKPADPSVQYARRGREPLGNFLTTAVRGAAQRGNNLQARVAVRNIPKLNGKRLFGTRPRTFVRACAGVLLSRDAEGGISEFVAEFRSSSFDDRPRLFVLFSKPQTADSCLFICIIMSGRI